MGANTWEPPIDIISAKPTYSNMEIIYYIDADSIHCIALWSRHEANYVYSRRLALQFGRGSIFVFAKCIIGEAGVLANFSAQGVAALPARIFFLLDRVLRAFLASASLASACLLASVCLRSCFRPSPRSRWPIARSSIRAALRTWQLRALLRQPEWKNAPL